MALPEGSLAPRDLEDLEDYRPIHTGPGFLRPLDCPGHKGKKWLIGNLRPANRTVAV
jgi:hypothetical protein